MHRTKLWKRGVGLAAAGGFVLAGAGCFLPNTGRLTVVVQETFFDEGPPSFTFDKDTYTVPRGEVDVHYLAPTGSPVPHDLAIAGQGSPFLVLPSGEDEVSGDVDLDPGTYTLICSLPGHRGLGMEAELVVI